MKKNILKSILFLVFIFSPMLLYAQKKQLATARESLKTGKELVKAEKSMQNLLEDSVNRTNTKIWVMLCDILMKQYEQGNEKLYLKQQYDTAAFFSVTKRMYETMAKFDSIDAHLNIPSPVLPKYRERHAQFLNSIRPNLFNGGTYFLHVKDYKTAYDYFDNYIKTDKQSLFIGYDYEHKDDLMPHAAYWAMYCGYKLGDTEKTMRYLNLAERDSSMLNFVRQYEASAYLMQKDTTKYLKALQEGFKEYPNFAFFFPRLVEYYVKNGDNQMALQITDKALETDSTSVLFRFTKSTVLLNLGSYKECIDICLKLIQEKADFADAYCNLGLAYFDQAIELAKTQQNRSKRVKINKLYETAMPYLEQYKRLAPKARDKWLAPLYTIYLNLNMGKEFDEIDKLRNEAK